MRVIAAMFITLLPLAGHAAGSLQALTQCIADTTTGAERKDFARWIYVSMSQHPAMSDLANVPQELAGDATKDTARVFVDLLRNRCHEDAQAAYEARGQQVYRIAGETLGRLAMQELMHDPDVRQYMGKVGSAAAEVVGDGPILTPPE